MAAWGLSEASFVNKVQWEHSHTHPSISASSAMAVVLPLKTLRAVTETANLPVFCSLLSPNPPKPALPWFSHCVDLAFPWPEPNLPSAAWAPARWAWSVHCRVGLQVTEGCGSDHAWISVFACPCCPSCIGAVAVFTPLSWLGEPMWALGFQ